MFIGVGGSLLAAVLYFAIGWGPLGVISLIVAALSFWGYGVAANFLNDPQDMPNAAAILAVVSRPAAIGLLVVAFLGILF